jgi:hypothetical protein
MSGTGRFVVRLLLAAIPAMVLAAGVADQASAAKHSTRMFRHHRTVIEHSGRHVPTLDGHVCKEIGGVWSRTTQTCEISGSGTASGNFLIAGGQTVQIDHGASLSVTGEIIDESGAAFGLHNDGTLDNSGTITDPGSYEGGVANYSDGTLDNSGYLGFGYTNGGDIANVGTLDNNGYVQAWDINNTGSWTNESSGELVVDDILLNQSTIDSYGSILDGWRIDNNNGATITNEAGGVFNVDGGATRSLDNDGTIDNLGQMANSGVFYNEVDGTFDNQSGGNLDNYDSVDNFGGVTDDGTITDWCGATFTNENGSTYSGNTVATGSC